MGDKGAEGRLRALMAEKSPMTKERAVESLSLMLLAGRVKKPSSGGPPPSPQAPETTEA